MKFAIAVNMERYDPDADMREVARRALTLVQIAEQGGFEIALASEHHTIEFQIAPNPFSILINWAAHTSRIRLGSAVVQAAYWHPIRLAGEAALADVYSDGRLDFGIARGAFQYEFDRMADGIDQREGGSYLREILPAVLALWKGDYEHRGAHFSFPRCTSVPKPLQKPHPPLWVAGRDPDTIDWAVGLGADIMTTPQAAPPSEVVSLGEKFANAVARHAPSRRPRLLMQRRTCVYPTREEWRLPVDASIAFGRRFENLFLNMGGVVEGFPEPVDLNATRFPENYIAENLWRNFMFGTPEQVIEKLRLYESAGVDLYAYSANFGMDWKSTVRSLELFIERVMPAFERPSDTKTSVADTMAMSH
ncbi:MAG: LLM class flavin-dependent oxidoreductase [Pseudorhodoplanes sp.]